MINTSIIPKAAASATTQTLVVEATERLCKPFCVLGTKPTGAIVYTVGTVQVINGTAVVPITATVTIVSGGKTQVYTETFDVGFTATTSNTVTLSPSTTYSVSAVNAKCCKSRFVKIAGTLGITIA